MMLVFFVEDRNGFSIIFIGLVYINRCYLYFIFGYRYYNLGLGGRELKEFGRFISYRLSFRRVVGRIGREI